MLGENVLILLWQFPS